MGIACEGAQVVHGEILLRQVRRVYPRGGLWDRPFPSPQPTFITSVKWGGGGGSRYAFKFFFYLAPTACLCKTFNVTVLGIWKILISKAAIRHCLLSKFLILIK